MISEMSPVHQVGEGILDLFRQAWRIVRHNPRLAGWVLHTLRTQRRADRRRRQWLADGVAVPPFMIISITRRCNLRCKGCYSHLLSAEESGEMDTATLTRVISEARDLGTSIVLLAGGEPFMRADLLEITAQFPEIIFPVFTNGQVLGDTHIETLKRQHNVIPVVSIEGFDGETDARRGCGVYRRALETIEELHCNGIVFGTSLTANRSNLDMLTSDRFLQQLCDRGCSLFFYVEYVPVAQGTDDLVLSPTQQAAVPRIMETLRMLYPALFVAFPGDEEQFGGCLASGRGFVHVNHNGSVEPCPFAPYSDTSIKERSLREALQSPLLRAIRENHDALTETSGGCALWNRREWVRSLLAPDACATSG